jgi:response regulator NasT
MSEPDTLRVLVADEQQRLLDPVIRALTEQGHDVIAHEIEIAAVGRATHQHRPDVAIVVLHEDTRHALELISEIVDEATCPVVTLAPTADAPFVAAAAERGVFAHLDSAMPVELQGGLRVALERYRQYRRLLGAFDRRARIERAKGVLMERHGLDDRAAFERIRSDARSSRRPLIEVVDEVLASSPT